jgi:D-serine deaminase-like pyridoxal phosphate-dependent protein
VVPSRLADLPTPALIVDAAALDRNIRRMAAFFADGPCRLRPHVKAHKTPAIARRQLEAGGCTGLTCATVGEVEAVASLCDDVLLANEIVERSKCDRVAAVAREIRARAGSGGIVTVAVDSTVGLDVLSASAVAAGVTLGVLVDVNVGQDRCGVLPEEALALARRAARTPGLVLRGVMGYEGHLQPLRDRAERVERTQRAMTMLVEVAGALRGDGLPCDVVSAGGTGTYDISGRVPGITEVQAGSYALMDTDYAAVGVPFEQAFWVLGTVISRPVPERCVLDCGHKSLTKDHGVPTVLGIEGAGITALNDEHAVVSIPSDASVRVGDHVRVTPSHTDPTINLHDAFYVIDGERVIDVWPIAARGYRLEGCSDSR